jgi:hypothetical protein
LVAVLLIVRSYARRPGRFAVGMLAGLLVVGIYLALPNLDNEENRVRRVNLHQLIENDKPTANEDVR